jgi:hypothetical protein
VFTRNSYAPGTSVPDLATPSFDSAAASGLPQPGAVIFEIGLLLGIHLAVALAVTLSLGALGIT